MFRDGIDKWLTDDIRRGEAAAGNTSDIIKLHVAGIVDVYQLRVALLSRPFANIIIMNVY